MNNIELLEQIKRTIFEANDVFMNAKKELFDTFLDSDSEIVTIGTGPDEIIIGSENLKSALLEQKNTIKEFSTEIKELKINILSKNDTAIFFAIVHMKGIVEGKKFDYPNCRFSGVLELINGSRKFKHLHYSVGMPI